LCKIKGHSSAIFSVVFDSTGNRFFTGADDNLVKVWCAKTGYLIHTIRAHQTITRSNLQYTIIDIEVDPENELLVTASSDKTIRYWDLKTYYPNGYIHVGKEILNVQISPSILADKKHLVVGCGDGKIRIYKRYRGHFDTSPLVLDAGTLTRDQVITAVFHPSGSKCATGGNDGIVYLFSMYSNEQNGDPRLIQMFEKHIAQVNCICFSTYGTAFASGCKNGLLCIYQFDKITKKWTETKQVSIPDFSKHEDNGVFMEENHLEITSISWTENDSFLLTASNDGAVRAWDPLDLTHKRTFFGHKDFIAFVLPHPSLSRLFITGGLDGQVFLWDVESDRPVFHDIVGEQIVNGCFNPSGNQFVVTDFLGNTYLYGIGLDFFEPVPNEQFLLLDWVRVREDAYGGLIDEETQQPAHLVDLGQLVTFQRIPHLQEVQEKALMKRLQEFETENYLTLEWCQLRQTCHLIEEQMGSIDSLQIVPVMDKKQLLKRRRQIVTETQHVTAPHLSVEAQMDYVMTAPIPAPVSSGDEYSEDAGNSASEEENAVLDFSPNGSYAEPNSDPEIVTEPRASTRRNRRRNEEIVDFFVSEDEEDFEEEESVRYPLRTNSITKILHLSDEETNHQSTSRATRNSARGA
jgi:WD40 repeat protein